MADIEDKHAENVGGQFYVDEQCIDCDLCRETAPENFMRSDDGGYSYVFKRLATTAKTECDQSTGRKGPQGPSQSEN
jgi:ferredoxin